MRELQNVSLVLLTLTLGVVFISLQGCTNIQAQIPVVEQEIKDAKQAAIDKKASGKQKLKDLGLDDAEIKALKG